jgi:PfaD family protein
VPSVPSEARRPDPSDEGLKRALAALDQPVIVVDDGGRLAVATGGHAALGVQAEGEALPLLGYVPPLFPGDLGDPAFRAAYGVDAAYVAGEMANGIASEELVIAVARAGLLGVFGAAGLTVERVGEAIERLGAALPDGRWGVNLIHSPDDPRLESALVDLLLARGVRFVSASAYLDLTLPVVRYRLAGIHRDASGNVVVPNRLMAKVSRVEVATRFLSPPPERFVRELEAAGALTREQAELAPLVPMADDLTAEADSGGHTDNRPLVLLLPALLTLRDQLARQHGYSTRVRVGAAGGIATPSSVASAFSMGAAYVVTGSINQATLEAGTSDRVRHLLAAAAPTDVAMAPAADMFEMGVKVQVLTRGTLFAVRAARLYEIYRAWGGVDALPAAVREELESKYFRGTLEAAWEDCIAFFRTRDPGQLERAAREPGHKLALLCRSYLGQASQWANAGVADRAIDYQVWCGPAMGAFNEWARGSVLEAWENRRVVLMAKNLLVGAATLTRATALRTQLGALPDGAAEFTPLPEASLPPLSRPRDPHAPKPSARAGARARAPKDEPIAIVGMGAMFPEAPNLQAFWRLLRMGKDAVGEVPATHWSVADYYDPDPRAPDKTYAKRGAFLRPHDFDPTEFGIPPSILEATDTSQLLGLVVARMAMEDAGYGEGRAWNRSRASVILGVTGTQELVIELGARLGHPRWKKALREAGVDEETAADVVARIGQSYVGWQESSFPGLLGNVVAGRIANRLDLGGTNCVLDAACASSLAAVHLGVLELRARTSDLVLTGGVDCLNDIFMHMCFSKTPALSASGDVRPFSEKADGTLLGEGLGMVVLKRLSDAVRDGDRVYAQVLGVGTASDGRAKSVYAPLPAGQARALRAAYDASGVRPREVALLEAHGTGTKAGDLAEFEALREVYRQDSEDAAWCTLGTVKSQVGHTKAAAGAAGMMKAALALHHKVLLPTLKVDRPHPSMDLAKSPFAITSVAQPWVGEGEHPRRAAVSSFGFGGSNFHVVLGEDAAERREPAWDGSVEILALSADDPSALVAAARAVDGRSREQAFARSRETFDPKKRHRLVAVLTGEADVRTLLAPALERVGARADEAFHLPRKGGGVVSYGVGPAAGDLAFVFPGQGAQHVGMLRELSCIFPELLEALESHPVLARAIHPLPTFDDTEMQHRETHLTRTEHAQPALGLVGHGLFALLTGRFKMDPKAVAGHSYGELLALHAAGVLSKEGLDQASRARGLSMASNGHDHGTMLAVLAPLSDVERLVEEEGLALVLANRNGPRQGVLSGARAEIERAIELARARGMRTTPLAVGAAFHSPLVAGASARFRATLDDVPWSRGRIPVVANATGEPYPDDERQGKDLLASQIARPVRFDDVVARLYGMGARCFVEVGPRTALTGMVRAILGDRPFSAFAIDAGSSLGGLFDLASVLASVAAEGHPVELAAWERRSRAQPTRVAKMAVRLEGANYRAPFAPLPPRPASPPRPEAPSRSQDTSHASVQEGIRSLQAMQEQTARVHQLFLEGQRAAHQSLQALLAGTPMLDAAREPVAPVVAAPARADLPSAPTPSKELDVSSLLLSVVAETTGYPVETLTLDMGMEADLGIDSIKRVEILSMLSKRVPGAPHVNPEKLGSLRTLRDVADFLGKSARNGVAEHARPATGDARAHQENGHVDARAALLAVVAELTGYPLETLTVEMDMEADLGIDSIKRVEILSMLSKRIPGAPSVNPEKLAKLRTLAQVLEFVRAGANAHANVTANVPHESGSAAPALPRDVTVDLSRRSVVATPAPRESQGSSALPAGEVLVTNGAPGLADALRQCFTAAGRKVRVLRPGDDLGTGPVAALLLLAPEGEWSAASEGHLTWLLGLSRALAPRLREARALICAISRRDGAFGHGRAAPTWSPLEGALAGLAKTLAHEWPETTSRVIDVSSTWPLDLAARELVGELGAHGPREVGLGPAGRVTLSLRAQEAFPLPSRIERGAVVVVTGGARGVTAACARELGLRTGASLLLLGRSPEPTSEPAWLAGAKTEAEIKRAFLEQAPSGERPSPRVLGEACDGVLAAREIRATMSELTALGIRAIYRAADVRDAAAVVAALADARSSLGPIQGIIHGAGVVRDKRLEDKRDEDFDQVLGPKLHGLRTLLEATGGDDLRCLVLFASASGRFGRRGQSDYALANQALVSIAHDQAANRPLCRVVAIDWGPWEGGMVTPSLRREFEREGVPLIALQAGAGAMCDEALSLPGGPVEVVLGAGFGTEGPSGWALGAELRLDGSFPILRDHRIAGKMVLPLAMTLEWFAAAATRVSGLPLVSLDDVRVFRGVTLDREPEDVSVWVGPHESANGRALVLELRSGDHVCVRAAAIVGARPEEARPGKVPEPLHPPRTSMQRVYAEQLFHGPSLEAIRSIEGLGEPGMIAMLETHPTSERLLPLPGLPWTLDPLVLDGVFQAMIVWCRAHLGAPSLPSRIASLKVWSSFRGARANEVRAVIRVVGVEGMVVSADVDLSDADGRLLARLEGFRCTASASLSRAFVAESPPALTTA